jgi:hypothetical protein
VGRSFHRGHCRGSVIVVYIKLLQEEMEVCLRSVIEEEAYVQAVP